MDTQKTPLWNGARLTEFEFEGHNAKVIVPNHPSAHPVLAVKTEYFNAFPETQIMLLSKGFYLAYIQNDNRWGTAVDLDRMARFIQYVTDRYRLNKKCVPIGMSCGGLIAIKLAADHPELVSCLYLDAPVLNYMSCPCGFGAGEPLENGYTEILNALGLSTIGELMAYREMPIDLLPKLIKAKIPAVLVAGDSDRVVPYEENGIFLEKAYKENGIEIEVHIKKGCDHHPHSLNDPTPIVEFIQKHC